RFHFVDVEIRRAPSYGRWRWWLGRSRIAISPADLALPNLSGSIGVFVLDDMITGPPQLLDFAGWCEGGDREPDIGCKTDTMVGDVDAEFAQQVGHRRPGRSIDRDPISRHRSHPHRVRQLQVALKP